MIVVTACVLPGAASAETVPLPPGAAATQNDYFNAVSCPSAGDCVGVGGFTATGGVQSAVVEVEQNGAWTASAPDLSTVDPGGGQAADLLSVACSSAGNCVAVGRYADSSGDDLGLVLTETDGTWAAQPASLSGLSSIAGAMWSSTRSRARPRENASRSGPIATRQTTHRVLSKLRRAAAGVPAPRLLGTHNRHRPTRSAPAGVLRVRR